MKPRRTHLTTHPLTLPGGNEDNDLWVYVEEDENSYPVICSVWVPTDEEREKIANGENVRLMVWGTRHPPVAMRTTDEPLGRKVH
jgi:hypothetical protein